MKVLDTLPPARYDGRLTFRSRLGAHGVCRLRTYHGRRKPGVGGPDLVIVVLTELSDNPGPSVTNAPEQAFCRAWEFLGCPSPALFVEHYPGDPEGRPEEQERVAMVLFPPRAGDPDELPARRRFSGRNEFGPAGWAHLPLERFRELIDTREEVPS